MRYPEFENERGFLSKVLVRQNKPTAIILHHTGGTDANPLADTSHHTFEIVNEYHRQQYNFKSSLGYYIGYHYFIDASGKVTQGRLDKDEGAHCIGRNNSSLGICLAGNFDLTVPNNKQIAALTNLLKEKAAAYSIDPANIVPHRVFATKTCNGSKLADNWGRKLLGDTNLKVRLQAVVSELSDIIKTL